ncbi:MAG TPA: type II toxin-antitoxin system VapC family toxin [Thiotrichaceae bacterium]|nr:type II toxin-antitoxin system VapC family toxin [Thiotrichaceae bacterium]
MKLAYIDSPVWITRFEGFHIYKDVINTQLNVLAKEGWSFCVSEVVLLEVMAKPYQQNNTTVIDTYNDVFGQTTLLKIYPDVFTDALLIAQTEKLKSMDAIHVSIALHNKCRRFVSTDTHFQKLKVIPVTWIDLSQHAPNKINTK